MNPFTKLRKQGAYVKRLNRVIKQQTKDARIKIKWPDANGRNPASN